MPLDDREQRILEEIERQFYEEDPKLAETARTATVATVSTRRLKWAVLLLAGGLALMLAFFTRQTLIALGGFAAMVVSVAWIVTIVRRRVGMGVGPPGAIGGRLRSRWHDRSR
jgi:hypothetical protein